MLPKKVLIVDDSRLIHKIFGVMLSGATLVHSYNGAEALKSLAEHPDVEVVLLDINMPAMNGFEFLERVKSDDQLAEIPVVIISTEGKEEDTIRGLQAGAAAYVKKPFQREDLLSVLGQVMA